MVSVAERSVPLTQRRGVTVARAKQREQRAVERQEQQIKQETKRIEKLVENKRKEIKSKENELNTIVKQKISKENEFINQATADNNKIRQIASAREDFQRTTTLKGNDLAQALTQYDEQIKQVSEQSGLNNIKRDIKNLDKKLENKKNELYREIDNYSKYIQDGKTVAQQMKTDYEKQLQQNIELGTEQTKAKADIISAEVSQSISEARRRDKDYRPEGFEDFSDEQKKDWFEKGKSPSVVSYEISKKGTKKSYINDDIMAQRIVTGSDSDKINAKQYFRDKYGEVPQVNKDSVGNISYVFPTAKVEGHTRQPKFSFDVEGKTKTGILDTSSDFSGYTLNGIPVRADVYFKKKYSIGNNAVQTLNNLNKTTGQNIKPIRFIEYSGDEVNATEELRKQGKITNTQTAYPIPYYDKNTDEIKIKYMIIEEGTWKSDISYEPRQFGTALVYTPIVTTTDIKPSVEMTGGGITDIKYKGLNLTRFGYLPTFDIKSEPVISGREQIQKLYSPLISDEEKISQAIREEKIKEKSEDFGAKLATGISTFAGFGTLHRAISLSMQGNRLVNPMDIWRKQKQEESSKVLSMTERGQIIQPTKYKTVKQQFGNIEIETKVLEQQKATELEKYVWKKGAEGALLASIAILPYTEGVIPKTLLADTGFEISVPRILAGRTVGSVALKGIDIGFKGLIAKQGIETIKSPTKENIYGLASLPVTGAVFKAGIGASKISTLGTYDLLKYRIIEKRQPLIQPNPKNIQLPTKIDKKTGKLIYEKKYTGLELKDIGTWKPFIKGTKKGEMVIREYNPIVSPEVAGYFKGLEYVNIQTKKTVFDIGSIADFGKINLALQLKYKGLKYELGKHGYGHYLGTGKNIEKIIDLYPEFKPYLTKKYGSITKAKLELGKMVYHDLYDFRKLKEYSGLLSKEYGDKRMTHGDIFFDMWKKNKLPDMLKGINKEMAEAIRLHDKPKKSWKKKDFDLIEAKILKTADILELKRFRNVKIDVSQLPLKDVMVRMKKSSTLGATFKIPKLTDTMIKDLKSLKQKEVIVITKQKTTLFPFDKPYTHLKWATKMNWEKLGVPIKLKELSKYGLAKGKFAFGFHATTGAGIGKTKKISKTEPLYVSYKGLSQYFLRLKQNLPDASSSSYGGGTYGHFPRIYGIFTKGAMEFKGKTREITKISSRGTRIKMYENINIKEGITTIPKQKLEVEGLVAGKIKVLPYKFRARIGWRDVPIDILGIGLEDAKTQALKAIESKKVSSTSKMPYEFSYYFKNKFLPYKKYSYEDYYKIRKYKVSKSSKTSLTSKPYKTSKISRISKPYKVSLTSKPYKTSKISLVSKPYKISKISRPYKTSKISKISKVSKTSKISKPELPEKVDKYQVGDYKKSKKEIYRKQTRVKTYKVLIKRFGMWQEVGSGLTKTEAMRLGRDKIKGGLGATFKIVKDKKTKLVSGLPEMELELGKEFRTYKIKKGKKIQLKDTFIQIKPMRLGTRGERKEIQQARKTKGLSKMKLNIFNKKTKLKRLI